MINENKLYFSIYIKYLSIFGYVQNLKGLIDFLLAGAVIRSFCLITRTLLMLSNLIVTINL